MGLLGPDATSITYVAPDGSLRTEKTAGTDGAYLLVFALNQRTCNLYNEGPTGAHGPCGSSVESSGNGASPISPGPIRAIHYRDGHTCSLVPPAGLLASWHRMVNALLPRDGQAGHPVVFSPALRAKLDHALARLAASRHLSPTQLRDKINGTCPAVGYVAPHTKHLTQTEVASPISVGPITTHGLNTNTVISFIARQPVTSNDSWYEFAVTGLGEAGCDADGNGLIGFGNVHAGQRLTERISVHGRCVGTIRGVVGYMQNGGPTSEESAGTSGTPGQDGSIIVGHFSFTTR